MVKKIITNIFVSEEEFDNGFPVQLFEIVGCKDPKDSEKVAKWFSFKYYRILSSHYSKDEKYYLAIASDEIVPNILHCDEHHYRLEFREKDWKLFSKNENDKRTVENIMYRAIELHNYRKLKDKIWVRYKTQRVFCDKNTELLGPELKIQLYLGYRLSIEYLPNNKIGLILDSTTTFVDSNTLTHWLKKLGKERFEKEYNGQYVIYTDEKGNKKPKYFVNIREGYDIDSFEVYHFDSKISLRKKFADTNLNTGESFESDEKVAEIKYFEKYKGKSEFVPLGCLQYSPDLEDLKETEDIKILRKEIYLNPEDKYKKILKYLEYYREVEVGKYKEPVLLHFSEKNNIFDIDEIDFPILRFGKNHILKSTEWGIKNKWRYAKKNALVKFGYYKEPTLDKILIIYNDYFDKEIINLFRKELVKALNEWKLNYSLDDLDPIPIKDIEELDNFIKCTQNKDPEIKYGAILIINDRVIKYDDLKDCLNKHQIPSQGIKEWNCNKNNFERDALYHSILENTIAGFIGKCGGIPWIINDSLSSDFFIGLDSGGPKKQRSWSCAYVFDEHGEKIFQREAEYYAGEELPNKIFRELIVEAIEKKVSITNNKIRSLIIHRDGFLPKDEISGLKEALNELRLKGRLEPDFRCLVINIRKTSNFRFFNRIDGRIKNPIIGTNLIIAENQAILANTGFPVLSQSTAKPLLIEVLSICGECGITEVVRDVFYLSELNWGSPMTGFKMPITVYYAEKMIELAHLRHKPTYLPL